MKKNKCSTRTIAINYKLVTFKVKTKEKTLKGDIIVIDVTLQVITKIKQYWNKFQDFLANPIRYITVSDLLESVESFFLDIDNDYASF